jgi:hypothetical protein
MPIASDDGNTVIERQAVMAIEIQDEQAVEDLVASSPSPQLGHYLSGAMRRVQSYIGGVASLTGLGIGRNPFGDLEVEVVVTLPDPLTEQQHAVIDAIFPT